MITPQQMVKDLAFVGCLSLARLVLSSFWGQKTITADEITELESFIESCSIIYGEKYEHTCS